ncbi:MAG: copper chaperone PCu(A)C [Magnetococcales bacterium]|nr:copper chaperone PCu(A)C [Magnetococcales bacterium]
MKRLNALLASLLLGTLLGGSPAWAAETMHVLDPWVRAAPPVAQTQAAYMTLHNTGATPRNLVGAKSPLFAKVELHETVQHEGQSQMRAKASVPVAPGAQIQLVPGGLHIMLIGPQKPLHPKDRVPLTLTFSDGAELPVVAEVREAVGGNKPPEGHEHHNH